MKHSLMFAAFEAVILGVSLALFIIGILTSNIYYVLPFVLVAFAVIIWQRIRAYRIDKMKKEYLKKMEPIKK